MESKRQAICIETTKCLIKVKLVQERLQNFTHGLNVLKGVKKELAKIAEKLKKGFKNVGSPD